MMSFLIFNTGIVEKICHWFGSAAYRNWMQEHKPKAFGGRFVKQAVANGFGAETAINTLSRFFDQGKVSYAAFHEFCREEQRRIEREAVEKGQREEKQQQQEKREQRNRKALKHFKTKYMQSAANNSENR